MGFVRQASDDHAAVLFMDGAQVVRQMRAREFGAFLDGYVGLSDLADTDVRAVYVDLGPDLLVRGLVFFRIYFDDEGRADSHWDLPVEALARGGGKGPDLGAGPVHLVCRSQCPEPAFAENLWDPDMAPGSNHFQAIRKAMDANSLRFERQQPEEDIPVLHTPAASADADREGRAQRIRLARMIREQRLRIKTLQSVHRDALAELQREHRLATQAQRAEISELEQKLERQRLANEQLKQRLLASHQQYLSIQEQVQQETAPDSDDTTATNAAEVVIIREQLDRKQRELDAERKRARGLEHEMAALQAQEPEEGSLLHRLQKQDVFVVAYHAGVGHMTLPYEDIHHYFHNPTAYAADKCGLSEPAYREWLRHYEQPVCRHGAGGDDSCGQPVMRISQPADFRPGIDDHCDRHRPGQ